MRSPIRILQDWTQIKRLKEGWESALAQTPVGSGITIENLHEPMVVRALIELLLAHPTGLEVLDFGMKASLMRKSTGQKSMSPQLHAQLLAKGQILDADSLTALSLGKGAALPAHEFRAGVPANYNDDGGANFGVTFGPDSLIVKP